MGLETFTVVCTTCQSRIRIRNAALIGQLANCPKCRSIVLIQPPHSSNEVRSGVDSTAITQEAMDAGQESRSDDGAATKDALDSFGPSELPKNRTPTPEVIGAEVAISPGAKQEELARNLDQGSEYWNPPRRAAPSETWTSESTNRQRQFLLVGFLGLTSIVISLILLLLLIRWYRPNAENDSLALSSDALSGQAEDSVTNPSEMQSEDQRLSQSVDSPGPDSAGDSQQEATTDQSELSEMADPIIIANDAAGELRPSQGEDAIVDSGASNDSELIAASNEPDALPRQLRELAELLAQPFELTTPQTLTVPDRPPVTAEELGLTSSRGDRSLPPIDLHSSTQERLVRGVKITDMPLPQAVNYLSLISGIPVNTDLRSLAASGRDFSSPLSLLAEGGTVAELGQIFAQNAGLQIRSIDNQYWRLFSNLPDAETLPWQYSLDDLLVDEQHTNWFGESLKTLFPNCCASIRLVDGQLSADPSSTDRLEWFTVIRWIENWRRQLDMPSLLPRHSEESLRLPFIQPSEVTGLDEPLSIITSSSQPLASFLSSLCSQAGLKCWIDWPSLAAIGLSPSSPILSITHNRPVKNILAELAFEHGVTTAIVDKTTLLITQQHAYRTNPEVFVFPSQGQDASYWYQFLRPLTPVGPDGISQIQIRMSLDEKFVMVRCCYPNLDFN